MRPSGVDELGSHGTALRPLGVLEHSLQPTAADHLRVVVEEQRLLALGVRNGEVVDSRVVKLFSEGDNAVGRLSQVLPCGRLGAVVVHDQFLVIGVGGKPLDALYAVLQQGDIIPAGDNDADLGLALDLWSYPEGARKKPLFYGTFETSPLQSLRKGTMSAIP